jgi:hypothetical protein
MPTSWLDDGKTTSISNAPTRWGRVGFSTKSHLDTGKIEATVELPAGFTAETRLRLRVAEGRKMRNVLLNDKPWSNFEAEEGTITVPAGMSGKITIVATY